MRHLRGDLKNPFPEGEWTVVLNSESQIIGVRLNSKRVPVQKVLVSKDGGTKKILTYADWAFIFTPPINS